MGGRTVRGTTAGTLSDDELVFRYGVTASGAAIALTRNHRRKAARLQADLEGLEAAIRQRGIHHRLSELMSSTDVGVALWAATHRLRAGDTRGVRILQRIASGPPSLVRLAAELTVDAWHRGELASAH